ncbi:hypothetical protein MMC14_008815 [Varicellaria rhodocarpa]|nr:hypothetical protein [Varicellaria rhodocarpa]
MKSALFPEIAILLVICSVTLALPPRSTIHSNTDTANVKANIGIISHSVSAPPSGISKFVARVAQNAAVSSSQSSSSAQSPSESSAATKSGLSTGAVLGLAVGASGVIVATLMSFVLWCFCIRRHRRANSQHQLLDITSPSFPLKPTRTNSDLSQWTATSSSPLQPSDPHLRPLKLPEVAFPRNKTLPPSPAEMAGDTYKGQVAHFVTEVATANTPIIPNYAPQLLHKLDHESHLHRSKVFEAGGREVATSENTGTTPPIISMERNHSTTTTFSREGATRRAKELEDMYKEVKRSKSSPKTPSKSPTSTEPSTTTLYLPALTFQPNPTISSSSPPPSQSSTSKPNFKSTRRAKKPEHISSLDGRIRQVDGIIEFKRMTVKEWRRERGRDRMVGPRKGKERRVLGI